MTCKGNPQNHYHHIPEEGGSRKPVFSEKSLGNPVHEQVVRNVEHKSHRIDDESNANSNAKEHEHGFN